MKQEKKENKLKVLILLSRNFFFFLPLMLNMEMKL